MGENLPANDNFRKIKLGPWLPTKALALACGAKTYFNGNPCLRGHVAPRAASSRNCTDCMYEDGIRRRTSPETAEETREYHRQYRRQRIAIDPEFAERSREHGRKSDAKPERRQKQNARKKWRLANDNEFRERTNALGRESKKAWKKANRESVNSHTRTRRARSKGAEGAHTADDIKQIHEKQNFKCAECGASTKKKKHVDHIMPLALGGSNWPSNLQILCPFCNDSKGAKHPIDFANTKGRLL